jgi:hypothetical protein
MVTPDDVIIGQHIVDCIRPFLVQLLQQRLADKTIARHCDHLDLLGGELIRRRYDDPDLAKLPVRDLLQALIEEEGGPLIWPRITESAQRRFDSTCRMLCRFLSQQENRG